MIPKAVVQRLVELAGQAPSVHNTQPWIWRASGNRVWLHADRDRLLQVEDPEGRNLMISCGAALDHFRYAAHALGWDTTVTRFPKGAEGAVAVVRLARAWPSSTPAEDLAVLRNRCTDRRRFTSWPVPTSTLETLVDRARDRGALACAVADDGARLRLELLANQAHAMRERDPLARDEQLQWMRRNSPDGVPLDVVSAEEGPSSLARSRFGTGLLQETRAVVESGDGLIVLGGDADDPASWLVTGEALSALWLDATRAGLSVVPLSLPVEIDSVRDDLRHVVLDDVLLPHLLLRIGWQAIGRAELPRTPRRPVSEVLQL